MNCTIARSDLSWKRSKSNAKIVIASFTFESEDGSIKDVRTLIDTDITVLPTSYSGLSIGELKINKPWTNKDGELVTPTDYLASFEGFVSTDNLAALFN